MRTAGAPKRATYLTLVALTLAVLGFATAVSAPAYAQTSRSPAVGGSTGASTSGSGQKAPLYWGAWIEGSQTYTHYYGGSWENAPWDTNSWDRYEENAGRNVSLLHYGQPPPWEQTFATHVAENITRRGAIPFMDMPTNDVPLRDIASGLYDDSIREWATGVKAWNKSFFLRWNWEMNGTWFGWGEQASAHPADYVDAWRHFHDVVASVGATNVTWVWCPNVLHDGDTPLASLYPGDGYVDWTCMDGYNWGTPWQSFGTIFKTTYSAIQAIAPSKPMMIGETGSVEVGGSKAGWIKDAFSTLPDLPAVRALVWFNWRIYERGTRQEWPIESSAASRSAFRQGINAGSFTTNTYGTSVGAPVPLPRAAAITRPRSDPFTTPTNVTTSLPASKSTTTTTATATAKKSRSSSSGGDKSSTRTPASAAGANPTTATARITTASAPAPGPGPTAQSPV